VATTVASAAATDRATATAATRTVTRGTANDGGTGKDGSVQPTCEDLFKAIDQLRPAARKCCPSCNHLPCQYTVQDLCCPLTVDVQSSNDITAFENAIQAFKGAGCGYACAAVPCRPAPSKNCDIQTSMCQYQ
jgi:hypothetical protein